MDDLISRQAAIDAVKKHYRAYDNDLLELIAFDIKRLPPVKEKPFKLPEIYVAEGFDTVEGEDGNVGFGVYYPAENQIFVAGDVEDEIRTKALLHEICHWVQDMCGRPFDEDEANRFAEVVYDALPSARQDLTEEDWRLIRQLRSYHNGTYAKVLDKLIASAQPELSDEESELIYRIGYEKGKLDGVKYCTERLKKMNDSFCGADMRGAE